MHRLVRIIVQIIINILFFEVLSELDHLGHVDAFVLLGLAPGFADALRLDNWRNFDVSTSLAHVYDSKGRNCLIKR